MWLRSHFFPVLTFFTLSLTSLPAQTQPESKLVGRTDANQYVAPSGAYRVVIPVSAALGGSITDTDNVVTFQDSFTTHQSIACFKMDTTQRFEEDARGRKDYLVWFFRNFVEADFENRFPGSRIESAVFIRDLQGGAVLIYNVLPGGSMFADRIATTGNGELAEAKRGNLLFINNGNIYILSIELAEKAIEGSAFDKTVTEEDSILRKRLLDLLGKITFAPADAQATPAGDDKSAAPAAAAPAAKATP